MEWFLAWIVIPDINLTSPIDRSRRYCLEPIFSIIVIDFFISFQEFLLFFVVFVCCWLLLAAAGCCWLLLATSTSTLIPRQGPRGGTWISSTPVVACSTPCHEVLHCFLFPLPVLWNLVLDLGFLHLFNFGYKMGFRMVVKKTSNQTLIVVITMRDLP